MRGRLTAILVAALGVPASANAAVAPVAISPNMQSPQLTGDAAIFSTTRAAAHGNTRVLVREVGRGRVRTLVTALDRLVHPEEQLTHRVVVSGGWSATFATDDYTEPAGGDDIRVDVTLRRRPDGPAEPVANGCPTAGSADAAIDGDVALTVGCAAGARQTPVVVHRVDEPDSTLPAPPAPITDLAVAGDYAAVAYRSPGLAMPNGDDTRVLEQRVSSGATIRDVAAPVGFAGGGLAGVGADGSLLLARNSPPDYTSPHPCTTTGAFDAYAGVTGAEPHRLPLPACALTTRSGASLLYTDAAHQVHRVTPDGLDQVVLRTPAGAQVAVRGSRVAAVAARCADDALYVARLPRPGAAAAAIAAPRRCPARIVSRRLVIARGHAALRLSCPHGCRGSVTLQAHPHAIAVDPTVTQTVVIRRGARTVRIPVSARLRRALGTRPVVVLTLATPTQPDHEITKRLTRR